MKSWKIGSTSSVFVALALLFASADSHASKVYFGILGGLSVLSSDATSTGIGATQLTYGGTLGVVTPANFGFGVHVSRFALSQTVLGTEVDLSQLNILGEVNYFFSVLHIGAKVGEVTASASTPASSISVSTSTSAYGPSAGIDVPLGASMSIGAEGTYLIYGTGGNLLMALGALKFNF
jgi:hypothetical protein